MKFFGGLAQLARATALQAVGQRFDSVILHNFPEKGRKIFDMIEFRKQSKRKVVQTSKIPIISVAIR